MDQTLQDLNFDFIRIESDINFEARVLMSVIIANKHTHIMYTVEPDLYVLISLSMFLSAVRKAGV